MQPYSGALVGFVRALFAPGEPAVGSFARFSGRPEGSVGSFARFSPFQTPDPAAILAGGFVFADLHHAQPSPIGPTGPERNIA
jgi:hypothetical protein